MKQRFAIGAELDLATAEEMRTVFAGSVAKLLPLKQPPIIRRVSVPFSTDAAGNVGGGASGNGQILYRVPEGMRTTFHRITLDGPSVTPAAPLAAGWVRFVADAPSGFLVTFLPATGTTSIAPAERAYGRDAPRLNGGQQLILVGVGLTASIELVCHLQVEEWYDYPRQKGEAAQ